MFAGAVLLLFGGARVLLIGVVMRVGGGCTLFWIENDQIIIFIVI